MWILGKKIFDILNDEKITLGKKLEVFSKYKSKLSKEFENLTDLQVINYLFRSKLPVEVKMFLREEIEQLAIKQSNSVRYKNIYNTFIRRYGSNEDVLLLDYCPNCFKKTVINNLYGLNLLDVIRDRSVDIDKRKAIVDVRLSSTDAIKLLKEDLEEELINFIIDSKITSNKLIKDCIGYNSELSLSIKSRVVERRVDFSNIFQITKLASSETRDLVFKVKEKELEDYISKLDTSNILDVINSTSSDFSKRVIDAREDVVIKAVLSTDLNTLENCLFYGRDERLVQWILEKRKKDVLEVLKKLDDNKLLPLLKSKYLPEDYKSYIIEHNSDRLDARIKTLSLTQVSFFHLTETSMLPYEIKKRIFETHKSSLINKYKDLSSDGLFSEIKFGSGDSFIKGLLIELKVDESNIFELLSVANEDICNLILKIKGNIIFDYINSLSFDEMVTLEGSRIPEEFRGKVLEVSKDILKRHIDSLDKSDLYKYISDKRVYLVVKGLILEKFGIYETDLHSCLDVLDAENIKVLVDNYSIIKDFIKEVGIDYQSFLQYGSGSRKHSNWLVDIMNIITNYKSEFSSSMNYFFNYYYSEYKSKENAVYLIANFLEFIECFNKYPEFCINVSKEGKILDYRDEKNIKFLFDLNKVEGVDVPTSLSELGDFKKKLFDGYLDRLKNNYMSISDIKELFNDILFCDGNVISAAIGGSGMLRAMKKDNPNNKAINDLVDELMVYSQIIEMVNDSNNVLGLKKLLEYVFSNMETLSKIQSLFSEYERKVLKLFELDSNSNLTHINKARLIPGVVDEEKSLLYGGEVLDFSDKNYALYAHVLSMRDNIDEMMAGKSSGNSNFISVSPVSYRGQKYYYDRGQLILAYDRVPAGGFICSSIYNLGSNHVVNNNSSEVDNISRSQRGILETSAVIRNNSEALLYREGLKPCGLILPGGREPTRIELEYHKKYNLPFIITQDIAESIDNPKEVFNTGAGDSEVICQTESLKEIRDMFSCDTNIIKEDDIYTGREVALLTDCHSMYEPTLAVLEDMRRHGITEIYSLGDNVGVGPNPAETFDLLEDYGVISIAGNSEYYNSIGIEPFRYFYDEKIKSQKWTEEQLGEKRIGKMKLYPASIDLMMGDKKIALCHFANDVRWDYGVRSTHTYRANYGQVGASDQFLFTNSDAAVHEVEVYARDRENKSNLGYVSSLEDPLFAGKKVNDYDAVIQGHVHFDMTDKVGDTDIYTLRAVGMGYGEMDQEHACYYVLREKKDGTFKLERRDVKFNKFNLLANIYNSSIPEKEKAVQFVKTEDYFSPFF